MKTVWKFWVGLLTTITTLILFCVVMGLITLLDVLFDHIK